MSERSATAESPKKVIKTTKETHPHLPPGLILDENGKVCKVCNTWQDWAKIGKKGKKGDSDSASIAGGMAGFSAGKMGSADRKELQERESTNYSASTPQSLDRRDCPADTVLLGRSTWTFLHTTAAYYPLQASTAVQQNMSSLISSLTTLYPCVPCAEDFKEKVKDTPPDLTGREVFSRWLCERHNEVNEKLGKPKFECDWSSLNKRWKDGPTDGSCD